VDNHVILNISFSLEIPKKSAHQQRNRKPLTKYSNLKGFLTVNVEAHPAPGPGDFHPKFTNPPKVVGALRYQSSRAHHRVNSE
jgi:hypothetical protein